MVILTLPLARDSGVGPFVAALISKGGSPLALQQPVFKGSLEDRSGF